MLLALVEVIDSLAEMDVLLGDLAQEEVVQVRSRNDERFVGGTCAREQQKIVKFGIIVIRERCDMTGIQTYSSSRNPNSMV